MKQAYFAGGCFWCVEHDFRDLDGVLDVCSGYSSEKETIVIPSYNHHKGFSEAVRVDYDEEKISYKKLCQFFLDHIDPTDVAGGANTNSLIVAKNNAGTWSNPGVASSVSPWIGARAVSRK